MQGTAVANVFKGNGLVVINLSAPAQTTNHFEKVVCGVSGDVLSFSAYRQNTLATCSPNHGLQLSPPSPQGNRKITGLRAVPVYEVPNAAVGADSGAALG